MSSAPSQLPPTAEMSTILSAIVRVVDSLIATLMRHPSASLLRSASKLPEERVCKCLVPLLHALGISTNTISTKFGEPGFATRDCYSVARSVLECAVNLCYIIAVGSSAAERAHRHAEQKSYRDLQRESHLGSTTFRIAFSGTMRSEDRQHIEELKSQFEWPNGREKGWIDLSVDQRIAEVYSRLGRRVADRLHVARFALYRHSSEILHGTLFGAWFFLGLSEPRPGAPKDLPHRLAWLHMTAQASVLQAVIAVVEAFDAAYGFAEAAAQASNLHDLVHRLRGMRPEAPDASPDK